MDKKITQEERLDYLIEEFKSDSIQYKNIKTPSSLKDKKTLLRSLMNIRMPQKLKDEVIQVQDEYLKEVAREKGIVSIDTIPIMKDNISLWQGDITCLACDVIVNAANSQMLGCFVPMHACIDNCIHTYAGVQLRTECNENMEKLKRLYGKNYEQPTAIPMLTDAYNLPSKKVIHIVGPIVNGILTSENEKNLSDCYKNTLDMCLENGLNSVAFCCISTGVFHFPNDRAAEVAVNTVREWLKEHKGGIERVIFNVFKDEDRKLYERLLS